MYSGPVHKKILLGVILLATAFTIARGQITSGTANRLDSLSYTESTGRNPLFVFYQVNGANIPGSLTASHPVAGSYNFEWSRYNPALPGFDPPFNTENDRPSSTITNLSDGGYQVRIIDTTGTGTDTTMMAWVMLDNLIARVDKTEEDLLPADFYTCFRLALMGYVDTDTFFYYDPVSHGPEILIQDFKFRWTSDNEDLTIRGDTIFLAPYITFSPPFKDTWYILTATDDLGMKDVDSVLYESIQTKAAFSVEYYDKFKGEFTPDLTGEFSTPNFSDWGSSTGSTDATLTVRFINKSLNGAEFQWVLLDTLGGIKEDFTTYDTLEMPEFTYEAANKYYYPHMYSVSEEGCLDSVRLDEGIFVKPAQLIIPNVFSPNGDEINDVFYFQHQSLKTCKITIVDRTGKVVYKQEIDDIYDWRGWDGNMHESSRRAPEGQYYYVVEATGYDGQEFKDPTIWSQMKIFGGPGTKNTGNTGGTGGTGGTDPEAGAQTSYTGWLYLFRH